MNVGAASVMNAVGDYLPRNVKCAIAEGGYKEIKDIIQAQVQDITKFNGKFVKMCIRDRGYSFIQKVLIKVVTSTAPVIKLKSDSVTVNNGDTWNASNYISYINDDSGVLPALTITGNVDMSTDGNYTCLLYTSTILPMIGLVLALVLFTRKFILTDEKAEQIRKQLEEKKV